MMGTGTAGERNVNREYYVSRLGEYFEAIHQISIMSGREDNLLWFRGNPNIDFKLLPTLYRENERLDVAEEIEYSNIHLRESMRLQHYHAKNYPFIKNESLNSIEWLALGQHHGLKTRLLDWSSSGIHSLIVAVERQLNPTKFEGVTASTPCVWVLEPQELNKRIMMSFCEKHVFEKLLTDFLMLTPNVKRDQL